MTFMGSIFGIKCYVATKEEWEAFLKLNAMASPADSVAIGDEEKGALIVAPGKWSEWVRRATGPAPRAIESGNVS